MRTSTKRKARGGRHRVVVLIPDADGKSRFTSKPHPKAQAEKMAADIRANGFRGRKPESVSVVPAACDAVTAIMLGAMR